ncbi:MAG: ribonuclease H-like domain-containing protein [bacterium]
MNKLFFDIETLPAPEHQHKALSELYQKKHGDLPEEEQDFEGYLDKTGLDGAYGRVLVIAYAINDNKVEYICNENDEAKTLRQFWDIARDADLFVGHNIMDFDLRFLYQRSVVQKVKPTKDLTYFFVRYRNTPVYDTLKEWAKWSMDRTPKNLEHVAVALGIPTPKEDIDGSQVAEFHKQGKLQEICDYCVRDVDTVREVYKRLTFDGQ